VILRAWLILLVVSLALPAQAWGPRGHQVVAHIAAANLSPGARAAVAQLLDGEAEAMMALGANWADEIRDRRPETGPWHYVNLQIDGALRYQPVRDCPRGDCVVSQIARQQAVLKSNAPRAARAEALKFLIHLVGDVHQPLHAADNHDRGGNRITLRWRGQRITLHHFWDDEVVALQGHDPLVIARAIDGAIPQAQKKQLADGSPIQWALGSAAIAQNAIYPRMGQGQPPDAREAAGYAGIARLQLARAGYALAATLNAIYR
jgi:hypothetical protein